MDVSVDNKIKIHQWHALFQNIFPLYINDEGIEYSLVLKIYFSHRLPSGFMCATLVYMCCK